MQPVSTGNRPPVAAVGTRVDRSSPGRTKPLDQTPFKSMEDLWKRKHIASLATSEASEAKPRSFFARFWRGFHQQDVC